MVNDLPPGDEDVEVADDAGLDEPDPQPEVDVAALQREVEQLRNRDSALDRDLKAAIGRFQSSIDKLSSGRGDSDKIAVQAQSQFEAVNAAMDALLQDETIAPETRARVQQQRDRAKADSELAAMKAQLEALTNASNAQQDSGPASNPTYGLQTELEEWIADEELDPNDPIFDWKGEATVLLRNEGEAAVRRYFRRKINEAKADRDAADRRQDRKTSAGEKVTPAGDSLRDLDPSKPLEERLRIMAEHGIIPPP